MNETNQAFVAFMDTAKMQALFQQTLPDCLTGEWTLTGCDIQHPRYKTYVNPASRDKSFLALAYHLKGINSHIQVADDRILYAKAYLGSRSQAEYAKAVAALKPAQKHALLHLEQYGLVGWFFPCDPVMSWLPKMLEIDVMRRYFMDFLRAQHHGSYLTIQALTVSIVNYRPEIRCTFRYDLRTFSGHFIIYGKSLADGRGKEIFNRIAYFHQREQHNTDSFVMAKPLGYDANLQTVWLWGVAGKPVIDVLNAKNADSLMTQIARHLVTFQGATIGGLVVFSEEDQLAEIQKKALKLQTAFPAFAQRIATLVIELGQQQPLLPLIDNRLIHGDFHLQQLLLLSDERIALFDFDELAMANPLMDVANFAADLYNFNFSQDFTERLVNRLFMVYQAESTFTIHHSHFVWHLRVQLLTRAYRAYVQQKPALEQLVGRFLRAAEAD